MRKNILAKKFWLFTRVVQASKWILKEAKNPEKSLKNVILEPHFWNLAIWNSISFWNWILVLDQTFLVHNVSFNSGPYSKKLDFTGLSLHLAQIMETIDFKLTMDNETFPTILDERMVTGCGPLKISELIRNGKNRKKCKRTGNKILFIKYFYD